jgi:hypothetical protein
MLTISRAGVAFADINGQITAQNTYDDNIFRTPDREIFPNFSNADDVFTLGGGGTLSLNKENFQFNVTGDISENWYTKNSFLSSLSYDGTLELKEKQKYVSLDVQATQNQALSSFADIRTPLRNLQSLTRTAARVGLSVSGDIRFVLDAKFNRDTNTNAEISQADYNQSSGGIGVGYFSPSGNSLVLEELRTYTQGITAQSFVVDDILISSKISYIDDTTIVQLSYAPSPVIGLFAQGGYLRRTDQSVFHDNKNTPVGSLRLSYHPDLIAGVDISAGRQLSSQSYLLVNGITDSYIKANPTLTFPNGIKASTDFSYDQREYGFVPQLAFISSNTSDETMRYDATLSYKLLDNYEFGITGYHEERHSNSISDTYTDNGVMLTLTLRSARPAPRQEGIENSDLLLLP